MGRRGCRAHSQSFCPLSRRGQPSADNIGPDWTLEAAADPHRLVRAPDPKSRAGFTRIVGYSPSVGFVLTVIVDPTDWSGVTAWKSRGADLREYLEGKEAR